MQAERPGKVDAEAPLMLLIHVKPTRNPGHPVKKRYGVEPFFFLAFPHGKFTSQLFGVLALVETLYLLFFI